MNSFCTSQTGPHMSLLLLQNSHVTLSAAGSASFQSMTTTTSLELPLLSTFSSVFRASPSLLVMKAAGMVMLRKYLQHIQQADCKQQLHQSPDFPGQCCHS